MTVILLPWGEANRTVFLKLRRVSCLRLCMAMEGPSHSVLICPCSAGYGIVIANRLTFRNGCEFLLGGRSFLSGLALISSVHFSRVHERPELVSTSLIASLARIRMDSSGDRSMTCAKKGKVIRERAILP